MNINDRKKIFLLVTDSDIVKNAAWFDDLKESYDKSDFKKFIENVFPSLKEDPKKEEKLEEKLEQKAKQLPKTTPGNSHVEEMKKLLHESEKEVTQSSPPSAKENQQALKEDSSEIHFQSPIKDSYKNVGEFSPGVATDKNHPKGHDGIDMAAPKGTPIYPLAKGIVVRSGSFPKSGNCLSISHPGNIVSFYAHCEDVKVKTGDKVDLDTVIATVGDTGNARGRGHHLHLEVKRNGSYVNPASFFNFKKFMA